MSQRLSLRAHLDTRQQGPRVDSPKMRAWSSSLPQLRMRAYGVAARLLMHRWLGPDDGTDDESTQGLNEGDRDPLRAGGQGRQGPDPRRVVRHHRLASQPCSQGAQGGVAAQAGQAPDTASAEV